MRKGINIKQRTIAIFFILFLVAPLLGLFYFTPTMEDSHIKNAKKSHGEIAKQIATSLDNYLYASRRELESLAKLIESGALEKQRLDTLLSQINKTTQFFKTFYVLDKNGSWVSFPRKPMFAGGKVPPKSMRWINKVLRENKTIPMNVNVSKIGSLVSGFATPLSSENGEPVMVLRGVIVLSEYNPLLSFIKDTKIGENGYAFIVDSKGKLIAHPGVYMNLDSYDAYDYSNYLPVALLKDDHEGTVEYEYEGQTWVASYRKAKSTGWGIIVQQPKKDIVIFARSGANVIIIYGAVTFVLSIIILFMVLNHSLNPLYMLIENIKTKKLVPDNSFPMDEIGQISYKMSELYSELIKSESELKSSNLEKEALLVKQEIRDKELVASRQQLRNLITHREELLEEERKHISREIHDEMGQQLTALKMEITRLSDKLSDDQEDLLSLTGSMFQAVSNAIKSVQRVSGTIRPAMLDTLGIAATIESEINTFMANSSLQCEATIDLGNSTLDKTLAVSLYRILQEALPNVARHAKATKVDIDLRKLNGHIILEVSDNGRGITDEELTAPDAYGLIGIQERVNLLDGTLEIKCQAGTGTKLTVNIPVKDVHDD